MPERVETIPCPLCEGRGALELAKLSETLRNPELRARLDARLAELLGRPEMAEVGTMGRNFENEVHSWKPTVPIWTRSPKE